MRFLPLTMIATGAALLGGLGGSAAAAPSEAWIVPDLNLEGGSIQVQADRSDPAPHEIRFQYSTGAYLITDSAGITAIIHPSYPPPEEPCVQIDSDAVSCPATPQSLERIRVETGAGPDGLDFRGVPVPFGEIWLGARDDRLQVGNVDGAEYYRAYGGRGDDLLLGGKGYDRFFGGPGADLIRTRGGRRHPFLPSRYPTNDARGGPGKDRIFGGPAKDWLNGGPGRDYVFGGRGRDQIGGGPGNDTIHSRDGCRDGISCGPGNRRRQHAIRDAGDRLVWFGDWFADPFKKINC
jgi:RTX calcium-binding nonapeptide repeat (4 copies)